MNYNNQPIEEYASLCKVCRGCLTLLRVPRFEENVLLNERTGLINDFVAI